MRTLRTPDERFADLPDFALPAAYAQVPDPDGGTLRMAWVSDGPADGPVVLLSHGEPSWSFLYRTVIPVPAAAGPRVVAPDMVGFGLPGAAGRAHPTITGAGLFLQEDAGEELGAVIAAFVREARG